jgi:tetratricopeptide (TPR) repeat protein
VVLACFAPALGGQFLCWDDQFNFTENVYYRGLSLHHLRWMFTTYHMGHYQPLSWITLAFDYTLWGMNPAGYHATNVLLHMANAVLFYRLSMQLLGLALESGVRPPDRTALSIAAATGALLFAIHPLRVESVAWVSERRDVLSAFFYLITVLAYLRMQAAPRRTPARRMWFAVSLLCLALSLLSKAWAMTLPVILLALDIYPLHRVGGESRRALLVEKIPYAVLAAAAAVLAFIAQGRGAEMVSVAQYGLAARAAQAAYGLCFYLLKTLVPSNLSPVYLLPLDFRPTAPRFIACGLAVVGITLLAIVARKRWPWLLVSWICYATIVSPVLGIVQTGPQLAADRYTYLSCLPWALLAAAGMYRASRSRLPLAVITALALVGVLGGLTVRQTRLWRDSTTLWNGTLRIDATNWIAYVNRGTAYEMQGDLDRAVADYEAAIRNNPAYAYSYFGRGNVRRVQGDLSGAFADYDRFVQLRPHDPMGYANRGGVRYLQGDLQAAVADYHTALSLASWDWEFRDLVSSNLSAIEADGVKGELPPAS